MCTGKVIPPQVSSSACKHTHIYTHTAHRILGNDAETPKHHWHFNCACTPGSWFRIDWFSHALQLWQSALYWPLWTTLFLFRPHINRSTGEKTMTPVFHRAEMNGEDLIGMTKLTRENMTMGAWTELAFIVAYKPKFLQRKTCLLPLLLKPLKRKTTIKAATVCLRGGLVVTL